MDVIPYESKIEDVTLVNFKGTQSISLMSQMIECVFYESLFEPLVKAEMLLYDAVSLFNNFPLIGEEIFLIKVKGTDTTSTETFAFVVEAIEKIIPSDKGREVNMVIRLSSLASLMNSMQSVMHAYNGKISSIASEVFDQYVSQQLIRFGQKSNGFSRALEESNRRDTKFSSIEESLGGDEGTICIPNLRPMKALTWLASRSVPEKHETNFKYLFWQANDGFHFETLQEIASQTTDPKTYKYYSDSAIIKKLSTEEQKLAITNLVVNNRIKTLDKIAHGYFEASVFEVNMQQLNYKVTPSKLQEKYNTTMEGKQYLNTLDYMTAVQIDNQLSGSQESVNRVKYVMNNRMDNDDITPLTNIELNWANSVRTQEAFGTIDLHITIWGDTTIKAGQTIMLDIPRMEGFNEGDGNNSDKLLKGKYIISEVKQLYHLGQHGSTVLRINKDDFTVPPETVPYNYGNSGSGGTTRNLGAAS